MLTNFPVSVDYDDIISIIEDVKELLLLNDDIEEYHITNILNDLLGSIKEIFEGYIFKYIVNIGDYIFTFLAPDNIADFNFSYIILFAIGIVGITTINKLLSIFKG